MELYKECPQRFKFRYIEGIPERPKPYFSFGQSVHTALEFLYSSQLFAPALEEVLAHYRMHWVRAGYWSPEEEQERFQQGQIILEGYYRRHARDWRPPLAAEYDFRLQLDGVNLRGKIDRIDRLASGRLHVIDYKTGKSLAWGKASMAAQMTLYQLAAGQAFDAPVQKLTLYHLPTLTPHESPPQGQNQIRALRESILAVRTGIDRERFEPTPEPWKCSRCDYRPICPAWQNEGSQKEQICHV